MKRPFALLFVVVTFAVVSLAQEPARARRGLDQLDLLKISPSADASTIAVDLETYRLLGPLIEHTQKTEAFYQENAAKPTSEFYDEFGKKAVAVYRSIFLIRQINKSLPPGLGALLDQNSETAKFLVKVTAVVQFGAPSSFEKEMADLYREYDLIVSDDYRANRRQLIVVMLRRLNTNFARIKVGA